MLPVWLMLAAILAGACRQPEDVPGAGRSQSTDVPPREREILMEFFAVTGGAQWKDKTGWGTDRPVCEWYGVACNYIAGQSAQPVVASLELDLNNLRGMLPSTLVALGHLGRLSLVGNELLGSVPEGLLGRWDRHTLEFDGAGNRFSNIVATASVTFESDSVLCSRTEDVHFTARYDAASMRAVFESVRCARPTGRGTICIVREGQVFGMDQFSRALALLKFDSLDDNHDYRFGRPTHQDFLTTTAIWGDGRHKTVKSYGRQGPVQAAQQLFVALEAETSWERESRKPRCSFER
jgi:hypothetical protein